MSHKGHLWLGQSKDWVGSSVTAISTHVRHSSFGGV